MLLDISVNPILERYKAAKSVESAAIACLHDALASGERDTKVLIVPTSNMESAHDESMMIYAELNAVRNDK